MSENGWKCQCWQFSNNLCHFLLLTSVSCMLSVCYLIFLLLRYLTTFCAMYESGTCIILESSVWREELHHGTRNNWGLCTCKRVEGWQSGERNIQVITFNCEGVYSWTLIGFSNPELLVSRNFLVKLISKSYFLEKLLSHRKKYKIAVKLIFLCQLTVEIRKGYLLDVRYPLFW